MTDTLEDRLRTGRRAEPETDRLERARSLIRQARDMEIERDGLEERLKEANNALNQLHHKTLPDLFTEVGIDHLGIPAEGNLPAYEAALLPYYKASIAAEWPPEKQAAAFQVLIDKGHGDVIKHRFIVDFPRGDREAAQAFEALLRQNQVSFSQSLAVPWNTLTALVKTETEAERPFGTGELEKIGATVGQIVKPKPRKEK